MANMEKYKALELRELQLLQLSTMKGIHEFCATHDIKYYIIGGTLLGAIRHKGFIPWDDDIDIAMMRPDYDKFVKEFSKELDKSRYFLQNYQTEKTFQPALSRVCIKGTYLDVPSEHHLNICKNTYIDVFPLDNVPDDNSLRTKQKSSLMKIDRLLNMKIGRIYDKGLFNYKLILKRIISLILSIIPYSHLQKKRIDTMTRYSMNVTSCVCSTVSQYGYDRQILDRHIYGKPKLYGFEDCLLYGPEQADEYLSHLYGSDYMQIPPKEKRVPPHIVYIKE